MYEEGDKEEANEEVKNSTGEYGFEKSNPIPVNGIAGEHYYLSKLRCPEGKSFFFHRKGSCGTAPDMDMVDEFELLCRKKEHHYELYLDRYHLVPSQRPPQGLSMSSPAGVGSTDRIADFDKWTFDDMRKNDRLKHQDLRFEGERYLAESDYDKAFRCFDRSVKLEREDTKSWRGKGIAALHLDKYATAKECFDRSAEGLKRDWKLKGMAYYFMGEEEKARTCIERALKDDPNDPGVMFLKGMILKGEEEADGMGNKTKAIKRHNLRTPDMGIHEIEQLCRKDR